MDRYRERNSEPQLTDLNHIFMYTYILHPTRREIPSLRDLVCGSSPDLRSGLVEHDAKGKKGGREINTISINQTLLCCPNAERQISAVRSLLRILYL